MTTTDSAPTKITSIAPAKITVTTAAIR
ncbi:hypothetical protein CCACVL1_23466 [Corchorus capsularis]|uniref:Uncharacterized protein n=1 Tax=Corchorus capsularis TaxID=210143 RepID=A0A1R3GTV1_COCAP|nr:hypothetical protein CCACVL1_23466 [Corchorus capsularis]